MFSERLIESYFNIVRKNIKDLVAKYVVLLMINRVKVWYTHLRVGQYKCHYFTECYSGWFAHWADDKRVPSGSVWYAVVWVWIDWWTSWTRYSNAWGCFLRCYKQDILILLLAYFIVNIFYIFCRLWNMLVVLFVKYTVAQNKIILSN